MKSTQVPRQGQLCLVSRKLDLLLFFCPQTNSKSGKNINRPQGIQLKAVQAAFSFQPVRFAPKLEKLRRQVVCLIQIDLTAKVDSG